jgi:uncharacterized protein
MENIAASPPPSNFLPMISTSRFSLALSALVFGFALHSSAALQLFPEGTKKLEDKIAAAHDAYKSGKFADAAKLFNAEAIKGNIEALFAMGRLYQEGSGVEMSLSLAEDYYRKAAAKDHEPSRYNLAVILAKDSARVAEGLKFLEQGAANGYERAQFELARLYIAGEGVTQNFGAAKDLLDRASKQADGQDAFYLLGQLCEAGQGTTKSLPDAMKHYEAGAERGQMQSVLRLADIYATGKENVKADLEKSKKYLRDAAAKEGLAGTALFNLGVLAEKMEKKLPEAFAEYKKAAEKGDLNGVLKTALMLQEGQGTAKDAKAAADWFEKAANVGAPAAMYALGLALEKGDGRDKDAAKGREWVLKAALSGNSTAMRDLGERYRAGTGTPKDLLAATTWLQKAVQAGDVQSAMILSEMLEKGDEVTRDLKASTNLLTQVAQMGVADAVVKLADNTAVGKGTPQDVIRAYALLLAAGEYEPAVKRRAELAKTMSKEQIAEADKEKERILGQKKASGADKPK